MPFCEPKPHCFPNNINRWMMLRYYTCCSTPRYNMSLHKARSSWSPKVCLLRHMHKPALTLLPCMSAINQIR